MKKLLIVGHMRHGKDTVAEMLKKLFGYNFESSSVAASRIFLYDALKDKYGYKTPEECFEDRINHRAEWHDLICDYNKDDKARLAKDILKEADIYVGMRSNAEVEECLRQNVFDLVIGVYDPRKPLEPKESFDIDIWEKSDVIIPNAEGLEELEWRVRKLAPILITSGVYYPLSEVSEVVTTVLKAKGVLTKVKDLITQNPNDSDLGGKIRATITI